MSAWTVVPCLLTLREEFNRLAPRRDKGADGTIGDTAHTSSSDHTPDEDSDVLRDHDADSKNEVHALDIDSTGPWPESFDAIVKRLVARERAEYNSATVFGRLQYVIWNRQIASRSNGWQWKAYGGSDPHTNHAHFSARYTAAQEADTRPWGVYKEADMPLTNTDVDLLLKRDVIPNPYGDVKTNPTISVGTALKAAAAADVKLERVLVLLQVLAGRDFTDEAAIVAGVLAGLDAEVIAAAIPAELAQQVADQLAARLQA
jgi:hypothetical protein